MVCKGTFTIPFLPLSNTKGKAAKFILIHARTDPACIFHFRKSRSIPLSASLSGLRDSFAIRAREESAPACVNHPLTINGL